MSINGLGGPAPINRVQVTKIYRDIQASPARSPRAGDQVELSPELQQLMAKARANEVRQDKVDEIRGQIANGSYETPDKIDQAVDRLIDDLLA
jgi:negative regulator of flagellin synthesis FlgM